jgi:hypothetical protein
MQKLRRIGVLSAAKMYGVITAIFGLFIGAMFSLFSLVGGAMAGAEGAWAMIFGVGAIIIVPIFYGLIGFVSGGLMAWIYNMAAGVMGGVEIEIS